ncbi:hypothetical protein DPV78_005361 [Talaromyces pinophilus]|jgi:hypothetical protein|nr:hypothetical protein DPV78_005361 [Talaromyces pinophilus]
MDAETATIFTSRTSHRSSSLLINESGYSYTGVSENENQFSSSSSSGHESWSSLKKFLLSRRPSQKYRTLERREPRRLRKKSLSAVTASAS